jgi:hypothetical protein
LAEETQMLPKAKEIEVDFEALGQTMLDRKKQLKKDGIPADGEHAIGRLPQRRSYSGVRYHPPSVRL